MILKKKLEELYLKNKHSSFEISKILNCSEHKVNYWIEKYGITKRSMSEAIYAKRNPNGDPFKIIQLQNTEETFLFGLGIGLYWGEGNKKNLYGIRLGNTDSKLIKKFIEFLVIILGIDKNKLRFGLQVFSDMSVRKSLLFWQKELGIPSAQFQKVIVTPARSLGTYKNKTKYGVLSVQFYNKKLRDIICKMIENM